jgi:hypothetical protein
VEQAAAAALLGAVVGGGLTLAATLFVELRRDRRRQIGMARLAEGEVNRSRVELQTLTSRGVIEDDIEFIAGPHTAIGMSTWKAQAALFVGALKPDAFEKIDRLATDLQIAGEFGFARRESVELIRGAIEIAELLKEVAAVRPLDRRLWHL